MMQHRRRLCMPFNADIGKILADTSKKEFIAFTKWMLG